MASVHEPFYSASSGRLKAFPLFSRDLCTLMQVALGRSIPETHPGDAGAVVQPVKYNQESLLQVVGNVKPLDLNLGPTVVVVDLYNVVIIEVNSGRCSLRPRNAFSHRIGTRCVRFSGRFYSYTKAVEGLLLEESRWGRVSKRLRSFHFSALRRVG